MLKLYLMASNGYLPALVFRPEQGPNRVPKEYQRLLPNYELQEDVIRSSPLGLRPLQIDEPRKLISGLPENNWLVMNDPTVAKPLIMDIQDSCPNSTLFGLKLLMSRLIEVERDGADLLTLSGLTGLQTLTTDYKPYFHDIGHMDSQLVFPNLEVDDRKPFMEFVGDLVPPSEITLHEDGRVLFSGTRTEMNDALSILAEFYLAKNSANWKKQSTLIPHFHRLALDETSCYGSVLELETVIVAPTKSPQKIKPKQSSKKKSRRSRTAIEHRSSYIQACESLLSVIVNKSRNSKSAIPMLKKSSPELPNLLTQFSATIAGTGIAVLFSVMCKLAAGRVPFCSSKLLNTGLGVGLVWLSWAVNRLRDTIMVISRNSTKKKGLNDEEMMKRLDGSVEEIYFRAAALMAVMVLRLA